MRALLSLVLLAVISNAASAQTITRVDIGNVGLYDLKRGTAVAVPGTLSGATRAVTDFELAKATTTVPARLGVHFGFEYTITARARGKVTFTKVMLVPQPGIHNPDTGNTLVRSEQTLTEEVGVTLYSGYTFDHPWELVTGMWTIEFWDGNRKLASQTFNVVSP